MTDLEAQISSKLQRIVAVVTRLTGLTSRWSGIVELVPDAEFKGMKRFSCSILLNAALAQEAVRWATLLHEILHSCSAGYSPDDYQKLRGWEEGVVEQLQRLLRAQVLAELGIDLQPETFMADEAAHRYNVYIAALEEVRQALHAEGTADDAMRFYIDLLAVPLRDRPGYMLGLGYQRVGLPRAPFVRALSSANAVLTRRVI